VKSLAPPPNSPVCPCASGFGWIQIATLDDVAGFVALELGDEPPPPQCVSKSAPSATQNDRVTLISILLTFAL
jgi:hypothetical protein